MNSKARCLAILPAVALACSCSSVATRIVTNPENATITIDGSPHTSPFVVRSQRRMFGFGGKAVRVDADGFNGHELVLEFVTDPKCVKDSLALVVTAIFFIFPAVAGLVFLPWCTKFEEDEYFVELEPVEAMTPAP